MRLTSAILATGLAFAGSSSAATHKVIVGNGSLAFEPNTTYAAVGDEVIFHFYPKDHNVVQGPYNTPCMSSSGIYSGFIPSAEGQANRTFHVKINDTKPIWYFCSQEALGGHCTAGMVGVINPPNGTNHTLAKYKAAAATVSNTSYSHPSQVEGGVIVLRTNGTHNGTSTTSTATGSASATSKTTVATANAAAAFEAAKWGVGAIAGGLAVLIL